MEKQFEDLKLNDSFGSNQESPRTGINRTLSFPSSQIRFCSASEESKSLKLSRHCSEQTLCPNINTRKATTSSEIMHSWNPASTIEKVSSVSTLMPLDNQVEWMEVEKYPDSTKHICDTALFTLAPTQVVQRTTIKMEKFIDPTDSERHTDLSKSIFRESSLATVIAQTQTNILRSVNSKSQPLETNEDVEKLISTRKLKTSILKETEDNTNKNDEDKKNYQKEKICPKNTSKCSKIKRIFCICFILPTLLSIVILFLIPPHKEQNDKHSNTFATAAVELKKQIFGQDQAIDALAEYLQQDLPLLKIIVLVGGTGVGKSYTIEIIRKNFREKTKNHFFGPDLLILEDMRAESLTDFVTSIKKYQETYGDRYYTILAVFNVEQINDDLTRSVDLNKSINTMKNAFASANLDIKIIRYEPLNKDALEKCILNTAKNIRLILSQDQIALIKQQLIENNTGCKGAYGKVQVIGRQYRV